MSAVSYIKVRLLPAVGRSFQNPAASSSRCSASIPAKALTQPATHVPSLVHLGNCTAPRHLFLNALCDLGSSGLGGRVNNETLLAASDGAMKRSLSQPRWRIVALNSASRRPRNHLSASRSFYIQRLCGHASSIYYVV